MVVAERAPDAFEVALAALRRRERATAELGSWLATRGFGSEEIEATIDRLTEVGELDDERFARRYAEDKRELRGWGGERIREALASRGVAPAVVELALEADSHGAQVERASDLLARRGQPLAGDADRARALGYLTRRGYEYEVAYEAIRLAAPRTLIARVGLARRRSRVYDPCSDRWSPEDTNDQLFQALTPRIKRLPGALRQREVSRLT